MDFSKQGVRVEFVSSSDPHTRLQPGDRGTIQFEDDIGTTHIEWDSGSSLGMLRGEDCFRELVAGEENDG